MNQWDERYNKAEYHYGVEPHRFLRRVLPLLPKGGKALGLAEGEGRNAVYLAEQGFDVLGVDLSVVGLRKAQMLAHDRGVKLRTQVADLAKLEMGQAVYDVVTAIYAHLPSAIRGRVLTSVQAALKPNGCFVGVWYHPQQLQYATGGPKDIDMLPTLADIQKVMPELDWLIGEEVVDHIVEGSGHTGECMVVYVLGRKRGC